VSLGHLPHDARLHGRVHGLPATIIGHLLHPTLTRRRLRNEQIGTFCKFCDGVARAGVSGKHGYSIRRFKTIGIRLVLARSRAFVETKMAVFDSRHLDIHVVVNQSGANIVAEEHLSYRHGAASVGNPDLSTYREIHHSGRHQLYGPGRPIDMDRLRAILIPHNRQQRTKTSCVIVMMVSDKNSSDLSNVDTNFRKTTCDAVALINDAKCPVDTQQIRRLRSMGSRWWAG
jgi:hypothetical protein